MTVFPNKSILTKHRSIPENQNYLMEILTYHLPERKLGDFLVQVRYYYDPTPGMSKAGFRIRNDTLKIRTPWILLLTFSMKKIGSIKNWIGILESI